MNKKYAVVLSGCGAMDGAEIQESVCALLAIAKAGNSYVAFAPDIEQKQVINTITQQEMAEKRNVMVEAARISRGIEPLSALKVDDFDGIVLPGGFGAAKNLFDFAFEGTNFSVLPMLEDILKEFHANKKPIGAMCISPVLIAKLFGENGVKVTIGGESPLAQELETAFGAEIAIAEKDGVVVDEVNKVATTPCYMYGDNTIDKIAVGADRMVAALDAMC